MPDEHIHAGMVGALTPPFVDTLSPHERRGGADGGVPRMARRGPRVLRGARGRQLQDVLAAEQRRYERSSGLPWRSCLAELAPEWGEGRIFRPYRDIRFSADKSPYKTHIGRRSATDTAAERRRAGGRIRHVGDGSGSARALPASREREPIRRRAGQGWCVEATGGRARGHRARRIEDGPEGLSQGPSADRAPAVQGHDHVAGVAGRRVARDPARPRTASWVLPGARSRSTRGFSATSALDACPSDGDELADYAATSRNR